MAKSVDDYERPPQMGNALLLHGFGGKPMSDLAGRAWLYLSEPEQRRALPFLHEEPLTCVFFEVL